ncbi:thioredoxin domain-containing protein [Clavibacter capsici]|uniref:DsbA family protein n=1 Tax=Clavibacter capsici TaxID=1874630 RepID=UPI0014280D5A|nr:thioredoxin domain-containing protein [Clavibacter capsici]QIS42797.1 thioredoxin domain-containing protein [Clavibacter capsici]
MSSTPPAHEQHGGHRRRREAAREKARLNRMKQRRRDVAARGLVRGGIAVALVAVVVVVGLVVMQGARPAGPGPQNMASDGILIGKDLAAAPTQALEPEQEPVPAASPSAGVAHIRVYVDYLCTACKEFQDTNGAQMEGWLQSGAATVEIHPVAILTSKSQAYSMRAANAAACVAESSPDDFWAFNSALFAEQPAEQSTGLSDDRLVELASQAGATSADVAKCVFEQRFQSWVNSATDRVLDGKIPDSNVAKVVGAPVIVVGDRQYTGQPDDAKAFAAFVLQAAGQDATPTPTPVPSETPTAAP